jgi:ATP-dependent Lon protease
LISRIPMINFKGYNPEEKLTILQDFLLPEITGNYGLKPEDIIISKEVARHMISKVKEEGEVDGKSGVRGLKTLLNKIVSRVNLHKNVMVNGEIKIKLKCEIKNFKVPYELTTNYIDKINTHKEKIYSYYL